MNSFRDHCRKHAKKGTTALKNKRTGVTFTLDAVTENGTEAEYRSIIADGSVKLPKAAVLGDISRAETFKFEGEETRAALNLWFDEEIEATKAPKAPENRIKNGAPVAK